MNQEIKLWADFRSDTTTHPTQEMRESVLNVPVGDDVYRDDMVTIELEELAAKIMGKEAGLFVASGTMGNQLAVMGHTKPADEIICHENCHIVKYEGGATPLLSQVATRTTHNKEYTVTAEEVSKYTRAIDIHEPRTSLVCLESPTTVGSVIPLESLQKTYKAAKERNLAVHLDGARIFHGALKLGVDVKEIANCADSVMFCLSKGLCAPMGSMLVGSKEFIEKSRVNRKKLGGGLRQTGFVTKPGIIALTKMVDRLQEDHDNAQYLAKTLSRLEGVTCSPEKTEINMVFVKFDLTKWDFTGLKERCEQKEIRLSVPNEEGGGRFVTNRSTTRKKCEELVHVLSEFQK